MLKKLLNPDLALFLYQTARFIMVLSKSVSRRLNSYSSQEIHFNGLKLWFWNLKFRGRVSEEPQMGKISAKQCETGVNRQNVQSLETFMLSSVRALFIASSAKATSQW